MTPEELRAIADQLACPGCDGGDGGTLISDKMNSMNEFITARCIETLAPTGGQSIVEIGPGNGALSEGLIDILGEHGRYHAIEHSTDMAKLVAERLSVRAAATIEVHCGDCDDAPIAVRSLDGIFAVNLLYFIADLPGFFGTLHGWLKPGGRVVFGVRSSHSLEAMPFTEHGFHVRGLEELMAALSGAGFERIAAGYHDEGEVDFNGIKLPLDSLIISGEAAELA